MGLFHAGERMKAKKPTTTAETFQVFAVYCPTWSDGPRLIQTTVEAHGKTGLLRTRHGAWRYRKRLPLEDLHRSPEAAIQSWRVVDGRLARVES